MAPLALFYYSNKTKYGLNPLIALALGAGYEVVLAEDMNELMEAMASVDRARRAFAAFSLNTIMLTEGDFLGKLREVVSLARRRGILTIAGGPHPSGDPLGTLFSLGFDIAFVGEAELSFSEFLQRFADNGDIWRTPGIAYLSGDKPAFTSRPRPIDLDSYDPFPFWKGIFSPIEITRGCPHGCSYCQVSYIHGLYYRHRSIDRIAFYVSEMSRRGLRDFRFITPDALSYGLSRPGSPRADLIEEMLAAVKKAAGESGRIFYGSFPSEVRPEHVTEEAVAVLKRYASNREVIIGAQSGSERILRLIRRGHTAEDVINAVDISASHGFMPAVDIIIGFPDEDGEDLEDTIGLIEKIIGKGGRAHLHYYLPLPGTPLWPKKPRNPPESILRRLAKLVGGGKAYGAWLNQRTTSLKIIELYEKGVIYPRRSLGSSALLERIR